MNLKRGLDLINPSPNTDHISNWQRIGSTDLPLVEDSVDAFNLENTQTSGRRSPIQLIPDRSSSIPSFSHNTADSPSRPMSQDSLSQFTQGLGELPAFKAGRYGYRKKYIRDYYGRRRRTYQRYKMNFAQRFMKAFNPRKYGFIVTPKGSMEAQAGTTYRSATDAQKAWRKANHFYGRGMYYGNGGYGQKLMRTLKRNRVGDFALQSAMKYAGSGNYNDLFPSQSNIDSSPSVQSVGDETGDLVITHTEYIGDIYGNELDESGKPVDFSSVKFILNPGMEKTFPWLSQLAANYQEYEFEQLIFKVTSSLSEVSSNNGQVGELLAVTQYKPSAPEFKNKTDVRHYQHYSRALTTESMTHGVECDPSKLPLQKESLYVRSQEIGPNESLNDYDWGYTQVCVHNTPASLANAAVGSLEVYYRVKLSKPIIKSSKGLSISKSIHTTGIMPSQKDITLSTSKLAFFSGALNNKAIEPKIESILYAVDDHLHIAPEDNQHIVAYLDNIAADYAAMENIMELDATGQNSDTLLKLTLPAHYSGFFKLKITVQHNSGRILSIPDIEYIWDIIVPVLYLGGAVETVNDIPFDFKSANTAPSVGTQNPIRQLGVGPATAETMNENESLLTWEIHFHASQATNKVDNTIAFCLAWPRVRSDGSACYMNYRHGIWATSMNMELEEYNPSFGTDEEDMEPIFETSRGKTGTFSEIYALG